LIAERVAADDDGLDPSWDGSRNALKDDWLAEDGAAEDVADLRESHVSVKKAGVIGTGVLTVPLGERHISFNLNSFTRSSSGVMVAHLMPTLYLRTTSAESTVTWSLVWERGRGEGWTKKGIV
jgi:hypothetical protein